jgi:hypothetical protein
MNAKHVCLLSGLICFASTVAVVPAEKAGTNNVAKAPRAATTNAAAAVAKAPDYAVIGHLGGRDGIITIKTGPKGPVYTVRNAKGKLVCENRSLDQLRAEAPELHQFIKTAVAGGADAKGGFLDASMGVRP